MVGILEREADGADRSEACLSTWFIQQFFSGRSIQIHAVDDEGSWTYDVVFDGTEMTFRVTAFMDDVDAPDLALFGPPRLIETIEAEMKAYSQ